MTNKCHCGKDAQWFATSWPADAIRELGASLGAWAACNDHLHEAVGGLLARWPDSIVTARAEGPNA